MREGKAILLNRAAVPRYNPIFISDCVELTIKTTKECKAPATIINLAGVENKSKIELLDMISEACGMSYTIEENEREELSWVGAVDLMIRLLGEPKVKLKEGIERMVKQRF